MRLVEQAHWCIAGKSRRLLRDYGYWYVPDGRNASQQFEFERVEVKPQALEWLFSTACGIQFKVSADNLNNDMGISPSFKKAIAAQARAYCEHGLSKLSSNSLNGRAIKWIMTLACHYHRIPSNSAHSQDIVKNKVLDTAIYTQEAL